MIKKGGLLGALVFFIFMALISISSAQVANCTNGDSTCQANAGYVCLDKKISDKTCDNLSPQEKVFSLLATGKCKQEVLDDSLYLDDLKYTSQAIIALDNSHSDTDEARDWVLSMEKPSTGLNWFLEIDTVDPSVCTIDSINSNTVSINANKEITSLSGGSCVSVDSSGYWLRINQNCYDQNFTISCDSSFITTLLYQTQDSDTIYVSDKTNSAPAQGETEEQISSLCFSNQNLCNYEETLWASFALSTIDESTKSYTQYLTASAADNGVYLPEAFLYLITGKEDFKNQLLSRQISGKWWSSTNDRYYGTALALYALQFDEVKQKTDSIDWLLNDVQNNDGCWDSGNIRNTAFILATGWPKTSFGSDTGPNNLQGCQSAGFYCSSSVNCNDQVLSTYSCAGSLVCCSSPPVYKTCQEQGGNVCAQNQICAGTNSYTTTSAGDLSSGQTCCLGGGICQASGQGDNSQTFLCEDSGGKCRTNGCQTGEDESFDLSCTFSSDSCCLSSDSSGKGSKAWIWVFVILILLVLLAIFFREKLKMLWFRMKSKFGKGSGPSSSSGPRGPSPRRTLPRRRLMQRTPSFSRPASSSLPHQTPRKIPSKPRGELDDVLKKLKEIGK